ncbi:BlaI/MecI/CopY family transcriptional regulator [Thermomonas sp. HDW16]|uniref:BlaI/MecI/CopY family transcriptional regulator n=1 Tax=Thermomonas sp. HDW16 TaxID=2714945 RepID=UPI00140B8E71|nr:BlaI/MecI/CopY family transcriptional regulator [Thermomonas sp. HDW16]QIL19914.1 BlaI/MecI/CopY family transcriptional regulator [Thermomonas sp. HDW16]
MQISEAESVVMDVLWRRHPLGAEDVVAELADSRHWQEATIKTLLNRLLNKGAIAAQREGRRYLYSPLLKREAWVLEESRGLLDRLFDGRVAPLVAHFSEQRKLSRKDIAELRKLLEELDDGQR